MSDRLTFIILNQGNRRAWNRRQTTLLVPILLLKTNATLNNFLLITSVWLWMALTIPSVLAAENLVTLLRDKAEEKEFTGKRLQAIGVEDSKSPDARCPMPGALLLLPSRPESPSIPAKYQFHKNYVEAIAQISEAEASSFFYPIDLSKESGLWS